MHGMNADIVRLDGVSLTLEDVVRVARGEGMVELDAEAARRVEASSAVVRARASVISSSQVAQPAAMSVRPAWAAVAVLMRATP